MAATEALLSSSALPSPSCKLAATELTHLNSHVQRYLVTVKFWVLQTQRFP